MSMVIPNREVKIQVSNEGSDVVVGIEGRMYRMPYQTAKAFSMLLGKNAKAAEETANAEQMIMDGAILFRSGAPFGVTDNKKINDEIVKEAVSNRMLRTSMIGGVKSKEQFGKPSVILGDPPTGE